VAKEHRLCKRILATEKVKQHALWAKFFFVLSKVGCWILVDPIVSRAIPTMFSSNSQ
jgi:hypothetical protein